MPKVSKESATEGGDYGPVIDRHEELDGYTVNFVSFRAGHRRDAAAARACPTTAASARTGATCSAGR